LLALPEQARLPGPLALPEQAQPAELPQALALLEAR